MSSTLLRPSKVNSSHLNLDAIVYIRQSTLQQVQHHQSSTQLQYELRERVLSWGWSASQLHVIDEDLGKSATTTENRPGFAKLVSMISMGQVGLLIGRESSRLARSCSDWYRLIELCALFGTLIADADGVYDPGMYNDRLLLGLKGTMSEAELHLLKQRMHAGRRHKAERGELRFRLPMGYVWGSDGRIEKDPDEQARGVLELVFEQFARVATLNGTLRHLVTHDVLMPHRKHGDGGFGQLEWKRPNRITLGNILRHPIYAGAYVYGRRRSSSRIVAKPEQWQSLIRDNHEGYITWQEYEQHVAQLDANRIGTLGTPRPGRALLTGLLTCAKCGCRLHVSYQSEKIWRYTCQNELVNYGGTTCQSLQGQSLDDWVAHQVLEALAPASLQLSLEVLDQVRTQRDELEKQWSQRLERARYEAQRASRQFDAVEPENRLVARSLEERWNKALLSLDALEREHAKEMEACQRQLNERERREIKGLAQDLPALWSAQTTTTQERQSIVRAMLEGIKVEVLKDSERVQLELTWGGGQTTNAFMRRPVAKWSQLSYYAELMAQLALWREQGESRKVILERLNAHQTWFPPKRTRIFNANTLSTLLGHLKTMDVQKSSPEERPTDQKWSVSGLASELNMPLATVYSWVSRGWISSQRQDQPKGSARLVLHVTDEQLTELRRRRQAPRPHRLSSSN